MTLDELKRLEQEEERKLRELRRKRRLREQQEREARWKDLGKVVEDLLGFPCTPDDLRMALSGGHRNGASHSMERPVSSSTDLSQEVDSAAVPEGSHQPEVDHAGAVTLEEEERKRSEGMRQLFGLRRG